jgi:hypothetical protein
MKEDLLRQVFLCLQNLQLGLGRRGAGGWQGID